MRSVQDLELRDGRIVRVCDSDAGFGPAALTVVWHHGSPQTGASLEPLLAAAAERSIRLLYIRATELRRIDAATW